MDQALTAFYLWLDWQPYTWFALFVLVNILDAVTTAKAMEAGGRELNPVMRVAMNAIGVVPALALGKAAILYAVFSNLGLVILYVPLLVLVYAGVVAWNVAQIRKGF